MGGGGGSKSSNETRNETNQFDNRVAATDDAIAIGAQGTYDRSVGRDVIFQSVDPGLSDFAKVAASETGETSRAAISSMSKAITESFGFGKDVVDSSLGLVEETTGDAFDIVEDASIRFGELGKSTTEAGFGFATNVLAGYEEARKDETERNFQMLIQAGMVIGVAYFASVALRS